LAGCGTTKSVAIDIPISNEQSFTFVDERPADQRISRREVSNNGDTHFYADDNLTPPPAEILRRVFMNRASQLLKGRTVTLTEFDVHVTDPDVSLNSNAFYAATTNTSAAGSVLAAPVILGIESIKSYKAVTVEIRGKIDSTELFAYHSDEFRGRVSEDDIRSVIFVALDQAIAKMQSTIHD
jgi:hypothetical protein